MSNDFTEFLVPPAGKAPKNLSDSVRKIGNASVAFVHSWHAGEIGEALATSEEAFEHLDFVLGELLRQRDVHRQQTTSWTTSPFKVALAVPVGEIISKLSPAHALWFRSLKHGTGGLPNGTASSILSLETAITKLKHRDTVAVNFSAALPYQHHIYALTTAGMGQKATLIRVDVQGLCQASKLAASTV